MCVIVIASYPGVAFSSASGRIPLVVAYTLWHVYERCIFLDNEATESQRGLFLPVNVLLVENPFPWKRQCWALEVRLIVLRKSDDSVLIDVRKGNICVILHENKHETFHRLIPDVRSCITGRSNLATE